MRRTCTVACGMVLPSTPLICRLPNSIEQTKSRSAVEDRRTGTAADGHLEPAQVARVAEVEAERRDLGGGDVTLEVGVEEELALLDDQPLLQRLAHHVALGADSDALGIVEALEALLADDDLVASVGCLAHRTFRVPRRHPCTSSHAPYGSAWRFLFGTASPFHGPAAFPSRHDADGRDGGRASGGARRRRPRSGTAASDCSTRQSNAATAVYPLESGGLLAGRRGGETALSCLAT